MKSVLIYSNTPRILKHAAKMASSKFQISIADNKIAFAKYLKEKNWDVLFFDDVMIPQVESFVSILVKKKLNLKSIIITDKAIDKNLIKSVTHQSFFLISNLEFLVKQILKQPMEDSAPVEKKSILKFKDEIIVKRQVAEDIENLPLFSNIIYQILEIIENPKSSVSDFENILSGDQVLMAKILSFSNSAYIGASQRINSISKAITLIGYETLSNIVISYSFKQIIVSEAYQYGFEGNQFINYSIYCGIGASILAKMMKYPKEKLDGFYIGGIIHNIGYLILEKYLKELKAPRFEIDEDKLTEKEYKLISIDHQEVGRMIINKWKLSSDLIDMVAHHHIHEKANNPEVAHIIYISSLLVKYLFFDKDLPFSVDQFFNDKALDLDFFLSAAREEYEKIIGVLDGN